MDMLRLYFIFDLCFYVFHRSIHHPVLYFIHKKHNSTYADNPISTHYMSFMDFMLEGILPFWIATVLVNLSLTSTMCFLIIGQVNGLITHSGYQLFGFPSPDNHHVSFNRRYGVGWPWDCIFGTN